MSESRKRGPWRRVALVLLWVWVIVWLPLLIFSGALIEWIWPP
jgi:hypothetical protein